MKIDGEKIKPLTAQYAQFSFRHLNATHRAAISEKVIKRASASFRAPYAPSRAAGAPSHAVGAPSQPVQCKFEIM